MCLCVFFINTYHTVSCILYHTYGIEYLTVKMNIFYFLIKFYVRLSHRLRFTAEYLGTSGTFAASDPIGFICWYIGFARLD